MDAWGVVILLIGAVVIGFGVEFFVEQRIGYEGVADFVAAIVGGFVASEYLGRLSDWGTQWYGMRIFPALIGAIVLAMVVEIAEHYGERYLHTHSPA
jgi:uncharacterized membrane protein YeaQ/YmgE (transglycosylase-associated protein family)